MRDRTTIWRSTKFHVSDSIYQRVRHTLYSAAIDNDSIFLSLFPIYIDVSRHQLSSKDHGHEEIYLPSTNPSTEHDLVQLQERLDKQLYREKALEIGICPKRRRIYEDLFDELIRTIALQCFERGFLLARIKNEYVRWMSTYEEIYLSGMAYGLRQYLYKSEEKRHYERRIVQLEDDCQQLRDQIDQESNRFEKISELMQRRKNNTEEQTHERLLLKKNVAILRSTNAILRHELANALNAILASDLFLGDPIDYEKETNTK